MHSKILFFFILFINLQIFTPNVFAQKFTLPPGITLPPGVTLPDEVLPENYQTVHQALIIRSTSNDYKDYICGGVIVLNYTILTSASCLLKDDSNFYSASELSVFVGFYSIESSQIVQNPQRSEVKEVITHGRYNRRTGANNLALLKLSNMISSDDRIMPTIPSSDTINEAIWKEKECVVLNYENDKPIVKIVKPAKRDYCNDKSWPLETFCTQSHSEVFDKCEAREGFPLICDGYLQGLVTKSCEIDDSIMQYNDISQLYYWIFIKQLDEENPYQLLDSELARYFIFGALDFIAWVIGTPKIADEFEVIKFFF
ncbi:hypothetical protein PVAND_006886 [Polypedilum vanderplanki]|uniref:Peptidase S1 domain-containing protein n=1 Tax=Polypedilum vanderplanki TaxID=319348 RepID=A0A9J6C541_POLVA|nr:hypothetical protein PVAND_006886 [Polypedilum vanderplanki]